MSLHTQDIELFKKGDSKVFEKLYKQFFNSLFFFANQYVDDGGDAENMVQETYLAFWVGRENFLGNSEASVKSWLYNTLKNKCLNHLDREANRNKYSDYIKKRYLLDISVLTELEISDVSFNEISELLNKALEEMSPQSRKVFELSRIEGLKNREIAEELNITVKAVEANMSRALKLLKAHLHDYLAVLVILKII